MQLLPDGDVLVPNNQFYQRRLNDGDVVLVEPPPETQAEGA
jgi:hypothetical protein